MKAAFISITILFSNLAWSTTLTRQLQDPALILNSDKCVLSLVATKMGVALDTQKKTPTIRVQNSTSLTEYQDAMEKFWHFRPEAFTNAYNPVTNEIFIMTEQEYYQKYDRFALDSLAHELVHYIQKEYYNSDFQGEDGFEEFDAVYYQNWFRDEYRPKLEKNQSPCT